MSRSIEMEQRSETAPLVGEDKRGLKKACDVLIIVPLVDSNEKSVSADHIMQDITVLDIHSKSFKETGAVQQVENVFNLCNGQRSVTMEAARKAFVQDLLTNLPKKGFTIRMFKSVDEDELFMRIILEDNSMEKHYAENYRLRLQTNMAIMDKIQIYQDEKYGPVSPPYLDYDTELVDKLQDELGIEIFKKYYTRSKEGSIFRTVDRIRIISEILGKVISLDRAVSLGMIKSHSPCHYKDTVHELRQLWSNFNCNRLFDCSAQQPLELIRNYFGEAVGFYFAFCGFYIRIFALLSVFAILAEVLNKLVFPGLDDEYIEAGWLAIMVGVGSALTISWKRHENHLAALWDQLEIVGPTQARADYRGDFVENPLNSKGKKMRMYPNWKLYMARGFTYVLTVFYMLLALALVSVIYNYRPLAIETFGKYGGTAISVAISIQILIFNTVWRKLTGFCVWLENPRTSEAYYQAFVWKQFVFQFFNAYQSFLYILFVQPFRSGCPVEANNEFEACAQYARSSLYTTFLSYGAFAIIGMAQPYLQQRWELRSETKSIEKKMVEKGQQQSVPIRSFMERQGKMWDYPQEDQVADMLELVIVGGYVLLFGVLAPGTTVIALFFFMLRLRVDGWKLCEVMKRPYPTKSTGLGEWITVLETLTWIGMAVSVATICVQLRWPSGKAMEWSEKFCAFFLLEHVMVAIKVFFQQVIGARSSATELLLARREYCSDRLILGKARDSPVKPPSDAVFPSRSEDAITLTEASTEWPDVDHENDVKEWGVIRPNNEDIV